MQRFCRQRLCLYALCCVLTGCAQTQYHAANLPRKYAARPVQDFSTLDLTTFAKRVETTEKILPGDVLEVNLNTGTHTDDGDLVWKVSVDSIGTAALPNIGPVRLAGLTKSEAEKSIVQTSLQRDVFLTPAVSVSVADRKERTILVTGAVATPGPIKVPEDSISLADAIVRAGGLTAEANGEVSVSATAFAGGGKSTDPNVLHSVGHSSVGAMTVSLESTPPNQLGETMIPEGAVIHVEERPIRPIQVTGVIRNQVVEVPAGQNYHLLDALTLAGGQSYSNWISDKITITRQVPGTGQSINIQASIRKARKDAAANILLAPNDIVNVEENVLTFTLSTLSGFIGAGMNATRIGVP